MISAKSRQILTRIRSEGQFNPAPQGPDLGQDELDRSLEVPDNCSLIPEVQMTSRCLN